MKPVQKNMNVDLTDVPYVKCQYCEGEVFVPAMIHKLVSAIQSPNGQEGLVSIQISVCMECGTVMGEKEPREVNMPDEPLEGDLVH